MKTPILRPPLEAVLFGFERIGMVVRIAWLPIVMVLLLYVGSAFLICVALGGGSFDLASDDPEAVMESIVSSPGFLGFYALQVTVLPLLASLLLSCVYVAATRASTLTDYEPPAMPFYFALGSREVKYFIVKLLYTILIAVVSVVALGLIAGIAGLTILGTESVTGQARAIVIAPGAAVALWLTLIWIWILLRFLPVLPIAAVENKIAFGEAWRMTKGNFWRLLLSGAFFISILQGVLFILLLAIFLPAFIVLLIVAGIGSAVLGPLSFAILALIIVLAVPAIIAISAFSLAAEAAFPARIYAYLSGCGDACRLE